MRTSVPMWGSTASKSCNWPANAGTSRTNGRAHLLLVMFDAVVPVAVHLVRRSKLRRTNQAESEPLGVGHIPDALRQLRILLLPVRVRPHASGASHRGRR